MTSVALDRKADTLLFDVTHYNEDRYAAGDVVLFDSLGNGKFAQWVFIDADRSTAELGVLFDPLQANTIAAQGTGTGNGLILKRIREDESQYFAEWYTWRTDSGVTENGAILNHIIAQIPEVESNITGDTNTLSKTASHDIFLTRTRDGNRGKIDTPVVIPANKNIVFDSILASFDLDALTTTGAGDFWLTVMPQRQGARVGCRNLKMSGAGVDFRGSTNGQNIVFENILAEQTRAAVFRTIDQHEIDNPTNPQSVARAGGTFNVTQFTVSNIEAHACNRTLELRGTTFSKADFEKIRTFGSVRSPILIKCQGAHFKDLEFIGVARANYATDAFIHIEPSAYHAVSDIKFSGSNRFGSEDTVIGGVTYQPPARNVLIGDAASFQGNNSATSLEFGGMKFGGAASTNANHIAEPVLYGIQIMCNARNYKIYGSNAKAEIVNNVVFEGYAANGGNSTSNNFGRDNSFENFFDREIFSHGGMGWAIENPQHRSGADYSGVNHVNEVYTPFDATINQDATDRHGNANNAYRLTSLGTGDDGIGYVQTNGAAPATDSKGRLAVGFWARAGQGANGRNLIGWRVFDSTNTARYVNADGNWQPITSDWRWYSAPVGQLSETLVDARLRMIAPPPADGQTTSEVEFSEAVLVSGEEVSPAAQVEAQEISFSRGVTLSATDEIVSDTDHGIVGGLTELEVITCWGNPNPTLTGDIAVIDSGGSRVRLLIDAAGILTSRIRTDSPTFTSLTATTPVPDFGGKPVWYRISWTAGGDYKLYYYPANYGVETVPSAAQWIEVGSGNTGATETQATIGSSVMYVGGSTASANGEGDYYHLSASSGGVEIMNFDANEYRKNAESYTSDTGEMWTGDVPHYLFGDYDPTVTAATPVAASSFASDHGDDMVLVNDAITITNTVDKDLFYMIDTEGAGATDNLSAINGGIPGQTLTLMTKDIGRSIIAIDSVNLSLSPANNTDFPMNSDSDVLQLICKAAGVWKTLSFPQNHV